MANSGTTKEGLINDLCRNFNQINMLCQQEVKQINFSSRPVNQEVLLMQALALPTALVLQHNMQMSLLILNRGNHNKERGIDARN